MGRLGAMLASHLAEGAGRASTAALPDFAVLSKGLTGGVLPLSAVLTTDAIYGLFDADYGEGRAFLHSNTYTGNALGVAVAQRGARRLRRRRRARRAWPRPRPAAASAALQAIAADRPYLRDGPWMWDGRRGRHPRRGRPAAGPAAPHRLARLPGGGPPGRAAAPARRHDVPLPAADHDRRARSTRWRRSWATAWMQFFAGA